MVEFDARLHKFLLVDEKRLAWMLMESCTIVASGGHNKHDTWSTPSTEQRVVLLANAEKWFPVIYQEVHHPVVVLDEHTGRARLIDKSGYDERTGIFVNWLGVLPSPKALTEEKVVDVVSRLLDLPFVTEGTGYWSADRVHALGLYLLPFVRPYVRGPTPMHLITSNYPGAGKSYLAKCAGLVATGEITTGVAMTQASDSEAEYILATALAEQPEWMYFDNLRSGAKFSSPNIHRMLTADGVVSVRLVGSGKQTDLRINCVWCASGNSVGFDDEIARRTIPIRLGPPKTQHMTADLLGWIGEHRSLVVGVLLSLIRDWMDAGEPGVSRSLASYESWSQVIGGILENVGVGEMFLTPAHRPVSQEDLWWQDIFYCWPRVKGGDFAWLDIPKVVALIDSNNLDWPSSRGDPGGGAQGRVNTLGRLIRGLWQQQNEVAGFVFYQQPGKIIRYRPGVYASTPRVETLEE